MAQSRTRSGESLERSVYSSAISPESAMRSGSPFCTCSISQSLSGPKVLPCRSVRSAMRKPSNPCGGAGDETVNSVRPTVKFPAQQSPASTAATGQSRSAACDFFTGFPTNAPPARNFEPFYHRLCAKKRTFCRRFLQKFHNSFPFRIYSLFFYCDMRRMML